MMHNTSMLSTMLNKKAAVWHRVKATTRDALGQYPQEDQLYTNMYVGVIPQTGGLLNGRVADTTLSRTTHKIITRYRTDLKPDMWIILDGQRYDILYIMNPYLNNERLEIFCEVVI